MQEHLFEKDILHCDKIDIQVLHEDGRDAQKKSKNVDFMQQDIQTMPSIYMITRQPVQENMLRPS